MKGMVVISEKHSEAISLLKPFLCNRFWDGLVSLCHSLVMDWIIAGNFIMYKCHVCSEWMNPTNISPFLEWHICETCTNKKYENDE